MVVLKCHYGSDTRRIRVDTLTYEELTRDILPRMYAAEEISGCHITYVDPEGDTIFITNEDELKEALNLCPEILVLNLIQPKRKNGEEEGSPFLAPTSPVSKKQKLAGQWRQNSMPVRLMVIEALKSLPNGGTIHDIMDFVNEQFPSESKNLKDLNRSIQALLSSRKEFTKAAYKQVDKLTKKECTVWTLSNQKGIKKVQKQATKPNKTRTRRRANADEEGFSEEEHPDVEVDAELIAFQDKEGEEVNEDDTLTALKQEINYLELITQALKGLGGRGTIRDIREWIISHHPEHWTISYKLSTLLAGADYLFEEEPHLHDGSKVWKLVEGSKVRAETEIVEKGQEPQETHETQQKLEEQPIGIEDISALTE